MGHVDAMPSKPSTGKFIVWMAEYIMSLRKEGNYEEFMVELITSEKLEPEDRQLLLQNAIVKVLDGSKAVTNWMTNFSGARPDQFKAYMEPLIGSLETEQLRKLDQLTNVKFKVISTRSLSLNLDSTG